MLRVFTIYLSYSFLENTIAAASCNEKKKSMHIVTEHLTSHPLLYIRLKNKSIVGLLIEGMKRV